MNDEEDEDSFIDDQQLVLNNAGSYYMRRFGRAASP